MEGRYEPGFWAMSLGAIVSGVILGFVAGLLTGEGDLAIVTGMIVSQIVWWGTHAQMRR